MQMGPDAAIDFLAMTSTSAELSVRCEIYVKRTVALFRRAIVIARAIREDGGSDEINWYSSAARH